MIARAVLAGLACTVLAGAIYIVVLHQDGALFYPFAAIAMLGAPIIAALCAMRARPPAPAIAGAISLAGALALFLATYAVWPQFHGVATRLPAFCTDRALTHVPAALSYGGGILIARQGDTAIVVAASKAAPFASQVRVIDAANDRTLQTLRFPNDVVMVGIVDGIAFIYNDKLGFPIEMTTGAFAPTALMMDDYSGLSRTRHPVFMNQPGDAWYVQTVGTISWWGRDGTVHPGATIPFNAVAEGCYVDGTTQKVIAL